MQPYKLYPKVARDLHCPCCHHMPGGVKVLRTAINRHHRRKTKQELKHSTE